MRVVYKDPDSDGVIVVTPINKEVLEEQFGELTVPEYESLILRGVPADVTEYFVLTVEDLPADREYRAAWRLSPEGAVYIDLQLATKMSLERIREKRAPLLVESDNLFMREVELDNKEKIAELKIYRQQLRDVTADVKTVQSIAELITAMEAAYLFLDTTFNGANLND